jgi:predicted O-linked N-acetylglucosamine transferase (SPINDLY family)
MPTIPEAFAIAVQHHQSGRLQAAETIYRQILADEPNHADALHLLGVIACQLGRHQEAIDYFGRAIALNETEASFHNSSGNAWKGLGNLDLAVAGYERAIKLKPDYAEALNNLGNAWTEKGNLTQAEACCRQALQLKPAYAEAHNNLGIVWQAHGNLDEAAACYQEALRLKPHFFEASNNLGAVWHAQGNMAGALACYERALQLNPNDAEAHNNLGNALKDNGKLNEAAASYQQAVHLKPDSAKAHNNLGLVWQAQGQLVDAMQCYQCAKQLDPSSIQAQNNLGLVLNELGNFEEAAACFQNITQRWPDCAEAHNNLGIVWHAQGKPDAAAVCYERALQLNPRYAEAHSNLGNALKDQGKLDEAVVSYHRALRMKPDFAKVHNNLGLVWRAQRKLDDAWLCFQRALELEPDYALAQNNLGVVLNELGRLDEAAACFQQIIERTPNYAEAQNNLGIVRLAQGEVEEAIACYRRAVQLKDNYATAHSNLIYALHYHPSYDALALCEEHRRWNQQHAAPFAKFIEPHVNDPSANRRLRIGYVSPDFGANPVGQYLLPILENHDQASFEICCYSSLATPDHVTDSCRASAQVWREVLGLSDKQLAQLIRTDQIDILVDLTLHMGNSRLLAFARKPAPVQVTYLAYCSSTGLQAMDYRLSDPYIDPTDRDAPFYSEKTIRLPKSYWCFKPLVETPFVKPLAARSTGHVTLGCLNSKFGKVSVPALKSWSRILLALPEARMLLHCLPGSHRDKLSEFFAQQGVSPERISFAARVPIQEYYQMYEGIDVALDPFPFGGGATTCDALWMGVPVVSLEGETAVGRGGVSVLSNVGLPELVAREVVQYEKIVIDLASDLPRLSQIHDGLRERMRQSPLMDASRFTRGLEAAYRSMWQAWCTSIPPGE